MNQSPRRIYCAEVIFLKHGVKIWKNGYRIGAFVLACVIAAMSALPISATNAPTESSAMTLDCKAAVLMEASTGTVLFEQNPDMLCPPASITKIMTLLLVMEAIESGKLKTDDMVTASAHAASMGGSQIFLKEGESMTVEDMIKSVVISSANDAALALAEHLCGSEEAFVRQMNERAAELGMKNTHFENTNGLDDTVTNHMTTARDVAIMSRALISHELILKYSSIWMDTIRDGAFGLTNTNRLVRFYPGATGLKTGSTAKAQFCISATAQRNGMSLICVIMGAPTRDIRNGEAKTLLDMGFASYEVYTAPRQEIAPIRVLGGVRETCAVEQGVFACVIPKGSGERVEITCEMLESVTAPIAVGQQVGTISYRCGDELLGRIDIIATEAVEKIKFGGLLVRILCYFAGKY